MGIFSSRIIYVPTLRPFYLGVPGFFESFFGKVAGLGLAAQVVFEKYKEGDNPLYREESGW